MKKLFLAICLLLSLTFVHAQSWVKEKNLDGITVYSKSSTQYRMKSVKAEMLVNASVDKVVGIVFHGSVFYIRLGYIGYMRALQGLTGKNIKKYCLVTFFVFSIYLLIGRVYTR